MEKNNNWIVFDGDLVPGDQPVVPAVSRGLMYGDGLFETFRMYSGQSLLFDAHLERLSNGMDILGIPEAVDIQQSELRAAAFKLLKKNQLLQTDAIIRLQVWRDGSRGYHPANDSESHYSMTASACPETFSRPSLVTVERRRIPSASLPSTVKLTNGINYILATREADQKGGDDALMQTVDGWVSETTIANIFWAKGSTIFSPSINCDLIPGITRKILFKLIKEHNSWDLRTGKFKLDHLLDSDSVWLCNSVREILPVQEVNGRSFAVESNLLSDLQQAFSNYRKDNLKPLGG